MHGLKINELDLPQKLLTFLRVWPNVEQPLLLQLLLILDAVYNDFWRNKNLNKY
jgi:hypothetical protein